MLYGSGNRSFFDKTKEMLDRYFADITKMEILIFMQDHKLLDDKLNDMVRTVENKRVKMITVVYGLRNVIDEEDIDTEGLLTKYFYDF